MVEPDLFLLIEFSFDSRTGYAQCPIGGLCSYLLSIIRCSPPFIGFMPSPVLVVVEQPLTNAKATASPKQRLILVRRLRFVFITVSDFLLAFFVCCGCEGRVRKFTAPLVAPRTPFGKSSPTVLMCLSCVVLVQAQCDSRVLMISLMGFGDAWRLKRLQDVPPRVTRSAQPPARRSLCRKNSE